MWFIFLAMARGMINHMRIMKVELQRRFGLLEISDELYGIVLTEQKCTGRYATFVDGEDTERVYHIVEPDEGTISTLKHAMTAFWWSDEIWKVCFGSHKPDLEEHIEWFKKILMWHFRDFGMQLSMIKIEGVEVPMLHTWWTGEDCVIDAEGNGGPEKYLKVDYFGYCNANSVYQEDDGIDLPEGFNEYTFTYRSMIGPDATEEERMHGAEIAAIKDMRHATLCFLIMPYMEHIVHGWYECANRFGEDYLIPDGRYHRGGNSGDIEKTFVCGHGLKIHYRESPEGGTYIMTNGILYILAKTYGDEVLNRFTAIFL
jgi:hypothetical protein